MPQSLPRDIGPAIVELNGVDLGPTFGNISFQDAVQTADVFEDLQGVTPVDAVTTGRIVVLTVPFTRQSKTQLLAILYGGTSVTHGITVKNTAGCSLYEDALPLIIKPACDGVAGAETTWIQVFKVVPIPEKELIWNNADQKVWNTIFKVFPVQESGTNFGKMYDYGVLVAPS